MGFKYVGGWGGKEFKSFSFTLAYIKKAVALLSTKNILPGKVVLTIALANPFRPLTA